MPKGIIKQTIAVHIYFTYIYEAKVNGAHLSSENQCALNETNPFKKGVITRTVHNYKKQCQGDIFQLSQNFWREILWTGFFKFFSRERTFPALRFFMKVQTHFCKHRCKEVRNPTGNIMKNVKIMLRHVLSIFLAPNSVFSMIAVNFLTYFSEEVFVEKKSSLKAP